MQRKKKNHRKGNNSIIFKDYYFKTMNNLHINKPKSIKKHLFKYYCFRTLPVVKSNFVPEVVPIGFEMAQKNANK